MLIWPWQDKRLTDNLLTWTYQDLYEYGETATGGPETAKGKEFEERAMKAANNQYPKRDLAEVCPLAFRWAVKLLNAFGGHSRSWSTLKAS